MKEVVFSLLLLISASAFALPDCDPDISLQDARYHYDLESWNRAVSYKTTLVGEENIQTCEIEGYAQVMSGEYTVYGRTIYVPSHFVEVFLFRR